MRIKALRLSWFRGAAANAHLDLTGRSMVVYGANGSGKSSFVDALEYVLNDGRIQHLAHEYSGKNQERAVLNTHKPEGQPGEVSITFSDDSSLSVSIAPLGTHSISGAGKQHVAGWDYRRTVLRQDEVSRFVHSTKGEKYSVLLPLLGLSHLETTAENLRQLGVAVLKQSGAKEAAGALKTSKAQFSSVFGTSAVVSAKDAIHTLCLTFVQDQHEHSPIACCTLVERALDKRLQDAAALQRMQVSVEELGSLEIRQNITKVRTAAATLARSAGKVVQARLEVLRSTASYLARVGPEETVRCPACGTVIVKIEMDKHVAAEMMLLDTTIREVKEHRTHCAKLGETVRRGIELCRSVPIRTWAVSQGVAIVATLDAAIQLSSLSEVVEEHELQSIEQRLIPVVVAAASAAAFLPPPAAELARAKEQLLSARSLLSSELAVAASRRGEELAAFIKGREAEVREEIRTKSGKVIKDISGDVQRMWQMLHPGEPIENVCLRVPGDTDKAIDISLKFYGKELESPRLTLSEGYRNSLGLCVFLAMAARDPSGDRPIILDDVIVSLDRGHRGMIAQLIQVEFSARQILLLTHDRDWYADLRHQLPAKEWQFGALLPYRGPEEGISWSKRTATFDEARALATTRPAAAANEARKVMDMELALYVDKLGLELRFLRGEKNDRRGAHEFLEKLISQGKMSYKRRDSSTQNYVVNSDAITDFEAADRLLMSWGNRGSHSEDVENSEAEKLIDACAAAVASLQCTICAKPVSFAEIKADGAMQCQCGTLRWK